MFRPAIKQIVRCAIPRFVAEPVRYSSAAAQAQPLVNLTVDDKSGIATLTLNRSPVNSLNLHLLSEISCSLDQLEANKSRGLIITSSAKSVFSAGLDIREMYKSDIERASQFYTTLQDVWLKLYGSSFPTAAAINGHAPAGGCLIAISCEYRVMCPKFNIGLNETRLGINAPEFFMASYLNVLPKRYAERALTIGQLFSTDEALKIGLIDEVATDKEDAMDKCNAFLAQFAQISPKSRAMTKQIYRAKDLKALRDDRKKDLDRFIAVITDPKVQVGLGIYLQSLKKK